MGLSFHPNELTEPGKPGDTLAGKKAELERAQLSVS